MGARANAAPPVLDRAGCAGPARACRRREHAAGHGSRQLDVPPAPPLAVDENAAAARLSEAIRARTVSSLEDATRNADQFQQSHALLQAHYAKAHAVMQREVAVV